MGGVSEGLIIILKASLQWAPVVGPVSLRLIPSSVQLELTRLRTLVSHSFQAMQLFQFIFLNKKKTLQKSSLYKTAQRAMQDKLPFALLLFPEGTLVSRLTRPKSASFAKTTGIVRSAQPAPLSQHV